MKWKIIEKRKRKERDYERGQERKRDGKKQKKEEKITKIKERRERERNKERKIAREENRKKADVLYTKRTKHKRQGQIHGISRLPSLFLAAKKEFMDGWMGLLTDGWTADQQTYRHPLIKSWLMTKNAVLPMLLDDLCRGPLDHQLT